MKIKEKRYRLQGCKNPCNRYLFDGYIFYGGASYFWQFLDFTLLAPRILGWRPEFLENMRTADPLVHNDRTFASVCLSVRACVCACVPAIKSENTERIMNFSQQFYDVLKMRHAKYN
jgi:hypothetical protein